MADFWITTEPVNMVEYDVGTGEIRRFAARGKMVYDKKEGIESPAWRERLADIVVCEGLDRPGEDGVPVFVERMIHDGLIEPRK